jgi:MFS family permease
MPWRIVSALSITHLVSYGTLFYAFALLIEPMERDLGWSKTALTAAFSLALVSSAFFAVPVGRLIDQGYGRAVMTGGSVLIWLAMGAAMSALFYDAGFAVLALNLGLLARRGITIITLVAGFASTVFIPLLHILIDHYGWRGTILAMAALNIGICALLHASSIPAASKPPRHEAGSRAVPPSLSNPRRVLVLPAFWLFVVTNVLQGIISTGLPIHLIPIFLERGFSIDAAVAAYAVIGPAQVATRFLTGFGERAMSLRGIGVATMALSALAFLLLPFIPAGSWLILAFAALYGASNGMLTIVKALLPPELFGREDYGAIQGMIAMPVRIAMAAAPFAFGALWAWRGSYDAVVALCLGMALCSLATFVLNLALAKEP